MTSHLTHIESFWPENDEILRVDLCLGGFADIDDDYRLSFLIEKVTVCYEFSVCTIEDLIVDLIEWLSHAIL